MQKLVKILSVGLVVLFFNTTPAAAFWNGMMLPGSNPYAAYQNPLMFGASPLSMLNPWGGAGLPMMGGMPGMPMMGSGLSPFGYGMSPLSPLSPWSSLSGLGGGMPYGMPYNPYAAYGAYTYPYLSPYGLPGMGGLGGYPLVYPRLY